MHICVITGVHAIRYVATPAYAAHEKDARKQRAAADAAKRKAETALVKLHQRQTALEAANAAAEPSAVSRTCKLT